MNATSPTYTILLSMRSPILAPLYLAKLQGGAFRHIDFRYGFQLDLEPGVDLTRRDEGPTRPVDLLTQVVLSKNPRHSNFIAGVADPFRAAQLETDSARYAPRVVGSIIRHQAFWLATDDERLKNMSSTEAAVACDRIITHPWYTCGYRTMAHFLDKAYGKQLEDTFIERKLFSDTKPGFERAYYERFARRCGADRSQGPYYAYLTTNPSDHHGPLKRFLRGEERDGISEYNDTLMTALFCGNWWYERHTTLMDDIVGQLADAVRRIYDDPIRAAVELKDYGPATGDHYMSFANATLPHDTLVQVLDEMVYHGAYAPELKLSRFQVERGLELRRLDPRIGERLWRDSAETIRAPDPVTSLESVQTARPAITSSAAVNYRLFTSQHYQQQGGAPSLWSGWLKLSLALLACAMVGAALQAPDIGERVGALLARYAPAVTVKHLTLILAGAAVLPLIAPYWAVIQKRSLPVWSTVWFLLTAVVGFGALASALGRDPDKTIEILGYSMTGNDLALDMLKLVAGGLILQIAARPVSTFQGVGRLWHGIVRWWEINRIPIDTPHEQGRLQRLFPLFGRKPAAGAAPAPSPDLGQGDRAAATLAGR